MDLTRSLKFLYCCCLETCSVCRRPVWILTRDNPRSFCKCYLPSWIWIWTPLVARKISRRYSTSVYVFWNTVCYRSHRVTYAGF